MGNLWGPGKGTLSQSSEALGPLVLPGPGTGSSGSIWWGGEAVLSRIALQSVTGHIIYRLWLGQN